MTGSWLILVLVFFLNIRMEPVFGYYWIIPEATQVLNSYPYPIPWKFIYNTDTRTKSDSGQINIVPQANPIELIKTSDKQLTDYLMKKVNAYNYFKRNVYNKFEPALVDAKNASAETPIKEKIYNLSVYTLKEVNSKLDVIQALHRMYREYPIYKLGYMISYVNRTHSDMEEVFQSIEENKYKWDLMTLLNSYEHIKNTTDLIYEMLTVLKVFINNQSRSPRYNEDAGNISKTPYQIKKQISWSYYDDMA